MALLDERRDDEEREGEELLKYLIIYSHYTRACVQPRYTRFVFTRSIFDDRDCPLKPEVLQPEWRSPFSIIYSI